MAIGFSLKENDVLLQSNNDLLHDQALE